MSQSRPFPFVVAVLLGDPRLAYAYNPSGRFEAGDYAAVDRLRAACDQLPQYRVELLDHHASIAADLERVQPELVLNFCNTGLGNHPERQLHATALLETLGWPYVGAGPECMAICHDKALVLDAAARLGVPVPWQQLVRLDPDHLPEVDAYPVLLKPNSGDGSQGMETDAVVRDRDGLARCVARLCATSGHPEVLIQTFLPGAEYSVGMIGNPATGIDGLPPLEVDYGDLDPDLPRILTSASKTDPDSDYWRSITLKRADLAASDVARIHDYCRAVFTRLGCRDYARFDLRCDTAGMPHLIDVNTHPMWTDGGMMATMAGFDGDDYSGLVRRYIEAARKRIGIAST